MKKKILVALMTGLLCASTVVMPVMATENTATEQTAPTGNYFSGKVFDGISDAILSAGGRSIMATTSQGGLRYVLNYNGKYAAFKNTHYDEDEESLAFDFTALSDNKGSLNDALADANEIPANTDMYFDVTFFDTTSAAEFNNNLANGSLYVYQSDGTQLAQIKLSDLQSVTGGVVWSNTNTTTTTTETAAPADTTAEAVVTSADTSAQAVEIETEQPEQLAQTGIEEHFSTMLFMGVGITFIALSVLASIGGRKNEEKK